MKATTKRKPPKATQLPSGAWRVQVRVGDKVVSITRDNPDIAVADALQVRAGLVELESQPKDRIKLTDAITEYIENRRNVLSPSTILGYKVIQENRMKGLMKMDVRSIDLEAIQAAINEDAKTLSVKSIKNSVGLIRSVLSIYTDINMGRLRYPQKVKKEHKFLDASEIVKLISGCEGDKCELPILFAVWLGLRRSEIFGLHWESVDFAGKKISIERTLVMGENRQQIEKVQMKNESSRRVLPCPDYILKKLESYQPDEEKRTGRIFMMNPDVVYKQLKNICEKVGIEFVGVHGLRHTNASVMLSLGIVDKVAMARGGWSTDNTMKSVYQHVFSQDRQTADDTINHYFESLVAERFSCDIPCDKIENK